MTTPRAEPVRTCIGCRKRAAQTSMVRCAIDADGRARVGRTAPGRGAWLCSADCFATAAQRKGFERAWRRALPAGTVDVLREAFQPSTDRMNNGSTSASVGVPSASTKG